MLCWNDGNQIARARLLGFPARKARPEGAPADESEGRAWVGGVQRQLMVAAVPYALAHLLIASQGSGVPGVESPGFSVAQGLFLLGTVLLWHVTRTLHEPVSLRALCASRCAGTCQVVAMTLALSPLGWWLAALTG